MIDLKLQKLGTYLVPVNVSENASESVNFHFVGVDFHSIGGNPDYAIDF